MVRADRLAYVTQEELYPWRVRGGAAALSAGVLGLCGVAQLVLLQPDGESSDAAGRGMAAGFALMGVWLLALVQVPALGFGVGVLLSLWRRRPVVVGLRVGTAGLWLLTAAGHAAVAQYAERQGVFLWDLGWYSESMTAGIWLVGFLLFGVALGSSRRTWWSWVWTLAMVPLAVAFPAAYIAFAQ